MQIGTTIGVYQVIAKLGEGGMGEVYRARDTKLNRDVAIKVLPDLFASDAERLGRFTREAQTLASLNHPHIAHIHGLEESGGVRALVMELVDGEDLSQRIARGALPLDEALPIARQIAEALEAAHERGIIHRDLKPANIKVRADGTVKVLDFGLAKLGIVEAIGAGGAGNNLMHSPTITSPGMTGAGMILGTAAYMSPEQARGKAVDKRADIWAFGAVLYEMLTGRPVFQGDTVTDTLAAVLKSGPDWTDLPATTPFLIKRLLRHCLDKDPRQRLGDIRDARIEIAEALTFTGIDAAPAGASRRRAGEWMAWGAAAVSLAAAIAVGTAWRSSLTRVPEQSVPRAVRFSIAAPDGVAMLGTPVVSPDGQYVMFMGVRRSGGRPAIWLRSLDALAMRPLSGTDGASNPFWAPDSRRMGFFADGKLKTLDLSGGLIVVVCDAFANRGGAWSADDVILFALTAGPLFSVSAGGGTPVAATKVDAGAEHAWPQFLPDGRFIFTARSTAGVAVFLASRQDSVPRLIAPSDAQARFAPPDSLLVVRGEALISQRLDLSALALTGDAVTVTEQVGLGGGGSAAFSVSDTNVLLHRQGAALQLVRLAFVGRSGSVTPVPLPPGLYADPALSPDGRQIALAVHDTGGDHIWVYDLARGTFGKRTFEGINNFAIWTPDSQYLTYTRGPAFNGPIMRVRADGSDRPETLVSDAQQPGQKIATSWSADGQVLAFQHIQDVMVREADGTIKPALATPAFEREGRFAPGGRWLAYRSDETGRDEVYVQSYPAGGGKFLISTDGGAQAMWAPNGRELFYKNGNRLMVAAVEIGTVFKASTPRVLVEMPLPERQPGDPSRFAITPDGQRFLVLTTDGAPSNAPSPPIQVVLNWRSGLK